MEDRPLHSPPHSSNIISRKEKTNEEHDNGGQKENEEENPFNTYIYIGIYNVPDVKTEEGKK